MRLMQRIRVRVLWVLAGVLATAVGVIVWTTLPVWPVVGVAVATLVVAVNKLTTKISPETCYGCGLSLKDQPPGEHGRLCPTCGTINPGYHGWLASGEKPRDDAAEPDA